MSMLNYIFDRFLFLIVVFLLCFEGGHSRTREGDYVTYILDLPYATSNDVRMSLHFVGSKESQPCSIHEAGIHTYLVGGFKHFFFQPYLGK